MIEFIENNWYLCWYIAGVLGTIIGYLLIRGLLYHKPKWYKLILTISWISLGGFIVLSFAIIGLIFWFLAWLIDEKKHPLELDCDGMCKHCDPSLKEYCIDNKRKDD